MEIEAGIDVFNKYGELNVLETLSGGDVTRWESVKALPYEVVLIKRQMNITRNEYDEAYREVVKANSESDPK